MNDIPEPFTEREYERLLCIAANKYKFCSYDDEVESPKIIWRHDIDYSPHRALAIAKIEESLGLRCIYHVLVSGRYYNLLEPEITKIIRTIKLLGHEIGLHFDMDVFGMNVQVEKKDIEKRIILERNLIEKIIDVNVSSMSFHNVTLNAERLAKERCICGLKNAYSEHVQTNFKYISDSNGIWRFQRLEDLLHDSSVDKLHVLTHPVWWTKEYMTPYQRFHRAIEGRANFNRRFYLETMSRDGRINRISNSLGIPDNDVALDNKKYIDN